MTALDTLIRKVSQLEADVREVRRHVTHAPLQMGRADDLTIANGTVTAVRAWAKLIPETGTSDDLDVIAGGHDGQMLILTVRDEGDTVTITPYTTSGGNIDLRGSGNGRTLTDPHDSVMLVYREDTAHWEQVAPENLNSLIGVAIESPSDGQALVYDADTGNWINDTVSGGGGPGAGEFLDLDDAPSSYSGAGGSFVVVNDDEDALEFTSVAPGGGAEAFTELDDAPSSYSGQAGKRVRVTAGADGLEFESHKANCITDWSYRNNNRSSSAFAWKGNVFTPYVDVEVLAIAYYGTVVAGATYQAAIAQGSGGAITAITKSATVTLPGTLGSTDGGWIWLYFATPQLLSAGTDYALLVGRTDGSDTYALPLPFNAAATTENSVPMTGYSHARSWRIAKANPQVGDSYDFSSANAVGQGFMFRYP